jgi:NADPH-dependent curcumin reductase CurA
MTMATMNRQLRVKSWPDGLPQPENFEIVEAPVPVPGDAQVLIRNLWLSIDPYYRHSLGPRFVGTKFCHPGDVMMGVTLGQVVESRDPLVPVGRHVTTLFGGMQDYVVIGGRDVRLVPDDLFGPGKLPLSTALGVAGIPGLTAYSALMIHAKTSPGETFLVSSAAGCVGATAGQLAMLMGLRAVGIAGSAEKVAWVVEEAGFDACVSYKSNSFADDLAAACPRGIDVNMEHVGGHVLDTVLPLMARDGRIVISGLIDQYNKAVAPPGPNWGVIVQKQLTVSGLRVFKHFDLMPHFERLVADRIGKGLFAYKEDISEGLEAAAGSLARVLTGANFGKSLVRIAESA